MKTSVVAATVLLGSALAAVVPNVRAQEWSQEPQSRNSVADRAYTVSLPAVWDERPDWTMAEKIATPGRAFSMSDCRAWVNRQTKAILQICSDRNWLAGKSRVDIEKQFLSPAPLIPGRSFLAERLHTVFFPMPETYIKGTAAPFLERVHKGKLTKDDIARSLVFFNEKTKVAVFLPEFEPRDLHDFYVRVLTDGHVVIRVPHEGRTIVDVSFLRHRFGSLGIVQTSAHKWVAFVLAAGETGIPAPLVKKFDLPADAEGKRIRFLWLVGTGGEELQNATGMVHVVLAETWDGTAALGSLAPILGGLKIGGTTASGLGEETAAHLTPDTAEPNPWHVNVQDSWRAHFGVAVESTELPGLQGRPSQ